MALLRLPNELLTDIIKHALPEGFESLALSCKDINKLCAPFIERHNELRSQFRLLSLGGLEFGTAWDLISRIAVEPIVARYIRTAEFSCDSLFVFKRPRIPTSDIQSYDPIIHLFADSPYFKLAGLDCMEYYDITRIDVTAGGYSQHAASFLLTLLLNVTHITLPETWRHNEATAKLIDAIIRTANNPTLTLGTSSLTKLTQLHYSFSTVVPEACKLDHVSPFLRLPRIQTFYGPECTTLAKDHHADIIYNSPSLGFANTLRTVHLPWSMDEISIARFLRHTTGLKNLLYTHKTNHNYIPQDWEICKFVTAIEREVGSHLEGLSITMGKIRRSIPPGRISFRGFQQLRKLEIPLEFADCCIDAATACPKLSNVEGSSLDCEGKLNGGITIGDLVPAWCRHGSPTSFTLGREESTCEDA